MTMAKASLLVVVLLSSISYSQTNPARFPGRRSDVFSPDRRYVLRNVNNSQEPYHSIFLSDKRTGKKRKVYDYGRGAAVVWAPDSRRFAVNDYAGSDFTNTYIFAADEMARPIDVQKEIYDEADDLVGGHHEYFGVARWLDNQRVIVHHWGHGDEGMFCQCYIYTLNGPVQKCARQPKSSDPEQRCEDTTP